MLFCSMTFIYVFLPVVLFFYFISRKNIKNTVLLIASIFFYIWGEPDYLYVMLAVILISYAGSIGIDKCRSLFLRRTVLLLTVSADLGFLFYFKYFNFAVETLNDIFSTKIGMIKVIMPIGISFYICPSILIWIHLLLIKL